MSITTERMDALLEHIKYLERSVEIKTELNDIYKKRIDILISYIETCCVLIKTDQNLGKGTTKALEALMGRVNKHHEEKNNGKA